MKIYLIGIGGIGVSALAQYYLSKGNEVSGSDLVASEITDSLKEKGIKIFIGNDVKNISKGLDLVIYSPAVGQSNQELLAAKELKIKCQSYPEALGELTKNHFTIAVSGTHGKSTTTSMIGLLLTKAGLDPTVIVGTKLKEFGDTNFRAGKSKYLVIEADEHFASFLNYWPKIIVLTSLEVDHLDYYKTLENLLKTFKEYVGHLSKYKYGILVANKDDKNINEIINSHGQNGTPIFKVFSINQFSIKQPEAQKLKEILQIPGEHNVYNALAALTVARTLRIPEEVSFRSLSEYKGAWRRFEIKEGIIDDPPSPGASARRRKITVVNDYAHHPTEVRVTLKAVREKYLGKNILCIYQPHQYQRTFYLFDEFVKVFCEVPIDKVIITDIYSVAGRESDEIKNKVNSEKLVKEVNRDNVIYVPLADVEKFIKENINSGDVLVIMGAGDIYNLSDKF